MMEGDTSRLRSSASNWSLAGDSQLLDILQSLHQTIITRCKETNVQLECMMRSLDEASIHLQNVNNKFLGLSNSQFVESRVYDDHTEVGEDNNNKVSPPRAPLSPVSSLKLCLHTLESLHEAVPVMDSDSDEEGSGRVILRPLYRRGRDTHEGVSSDAESEASSQRDTQLEPEYSDSDPEHEQPDVHEHTMPPQPPVLVTSHTPPDTRTTESVISPELDESPTVRKVYTDRPVTAQIFPEEPPPLEQYGSDTDDDIFADLHTHTHTHTHTENIHDDLFGVGGAGAGLDKDDVTEHTPQTQVVREKSPVTTNVEPEVKQTPVQEYNRKENVKKPAGGISMFGDARPEAIGAAVLRKTRRRSSTDSDVTDTQTNRNNVIDELFTKPTKNIKKASVVAKKEPEIDKVIAESSAKDKKDKIDLFSDDIFDDVDDIFTSNVMNTTTDNKKTLFTDDLFNDSHDNDLFNDTSKSVKINTNLTKDKKVRNIFDSDSEDDLFFDAKGKDKDLDTKDSAKDKDYKSSKSLIVKNTEEVSQAELKDQLSPNLFDDDDDLFSVTPSEIVTGEPGYRYGEETRDNQRQEKNEIENKKGVETNDTQEEDWLEEKHGGDAERSDANKRDIEENIEHNEFNHDFDNSVSLEEDSAKSTDRENNDEKLKNNNSLITKESDFIKETKDNKSEEDRIEDVKGAHTNDIFVDIFSDLPPAFEKPIEPKKSKNVNALFDDDSDDEALFFKKDDVITDQKPEIDFGNDRFRIFHDEPPDIDVDFTTKSASEEHTTDVADDFETSADFESVTNEETNTRLENQIECKETRNDGVNSNLDNVTKNTNKINILKLLENEENTDGGNENKDLFTDAEKDDALFTTETVTKEVKTEEETDSSERENRVIGKLKTKLNINVNTLLPGAVSKKPVTHEEIDGQVTSRSKDSTVEEQKEKVVSFKEETNSGILDNKLSKERARIQVKRRPSTRRARLEAVRKTGLDLGSDSTDNSSSFDEPVRDIPRNSAPDKDVTTGTKQTDNKHVVSKVVYVLNDEDIFDIPKTETDGSRPQEEDLKKTMNTTENRYQETQGEKRQEQKTEGKTTKKSLFDDSDDDTELFGKQTKKYIFDSDSDSELFGKDKGKIVKNMKTEEKDKERKVDKKPTKIHLFSDDSDEDLFRGKTKTTEVKKPSQPRAAPRTSQAYDDPLSVLEDGHSYDLN